MRDANPRSDGMPGFHRVKDDTVSESCVWATIYRPTIYMI